VVFFCCCPFTPSAGQNASNAEWVGYSVDFTAVAISQKYVRVFRPGRPLIPTSPHREKSPRLDSQDVTVTPSGLRILRLPGLRITLLRSVYR